MSICFFEETRLGECLAPAGRLNARITFEFAGLLWAA